MISSASIRSLEKVSIVDKFQPHPRLMSVFVYIFSYTVMWSLVSYKQVPEYIHIGLYNTHPRKHLRKFPKEAWGGSKGGHKISKADLPPPCNETLHVHVHFADCGPNIR